MDFQECSFYTVQEVPGLAEPTDGPWDLRQGVDNYLGHVELAGKSVLELGPASGFLTFHMENLGARVTCIELSLENDRWDAVPLCDRDWVSNEEKHRSENLRGVQNAFWFAHEAWGSKAKVIYSAIDNLPSNFFGGGYDVSVMGSVLLHLQNPFVAIQNMLVNTRETAVITDLLPDISARPRTLKGNIRRLLERLRVGAPTPSFMEFLPALDKPHDFAWWKLSPGAVVNMASVFGFGDCEVSYHQQLQGGHKTDMFTVVCHRKIPIEDCFY